MNLINRSESKTADYFVTGTWSAKASVEGQKYGTVNPVFPKLSKFNSELMKITYKILEFDKYDKWIWIGIPPSSEWNLTPNASYMYKDGPKRLSPGCCYQRSYSLAIIMKDRIYLQHLWTFLSNQMAVIAGNIKKEAQAQFDKEIKSPLLSDDQGNYISL